jgi:Zn-dependent M28 family amino/carboxypeptidase
MRKNFIVFLLLLTFVLPPSLSAQMTVKITPAERKLAENITAKQLSDYLHFVASDAMEGRDTPSRGLDTTAEFIKMNLSRWGFKPAGDNGTFFQKIALRRDAVDNENSYVEINGQKFAYNKDFFRLSGSGNEPLTAPVVYGRDGWFVKSKNYDAFQGVDVKDKTVVIYADGFSQNNLTPLPKGIAQGDLTGKRGEDWANAALHAHDKGAKALVLVAPTVLQSNWGQIQQFFSRGRVYVEKLNDDIPVLNAPLPTFIVSQDVGNALFNGETQNPLKATGMEAVANVAAFALNADKRVTLRLATKHETMWTQNVVGIWEGSDPVLKNEMVAIGAHYDHVGMNPNARGDDKIWNGADDDGSGTVAVLSIAEALSKLPKRPKRSVLFVWHAGEEKGLWGSEYFTKFPTVDLSKVIANLNIDMIGRSKKPGDTNPRNKELSGENEIYVIGSEMMSSTLGAVTKQTNGGYLNLTYNYKYDDPKDPNRFFFRSDHFNYAVKGIPIVFWFDGEHEDYHGAGDHPDKIDYAKMERVTRTIFMTLWELTDLQKRPKVDKQLPPELTQR